MLPQGHGAIEYILAPSNNLVVKIVQHEIATDCVPLLDVTVEITHLQLTLDKLQFLQLMESLSMISELDRQQQLLSCRPRKRPKEDPRSWWLYAVKLVRKKEELFSHRPEHVMYCMKARKRYMALLRMKKALEICDGVITMSSREVNPLLYPFVPPSIPPLNLFYTPYESHLNPF